MSPKVHIRIFQYSNQFFSKKITVVGTQGPFNPKPSVATTSRISFNLCGGNFQFNVPLESSCFVLLGKDLTNQPSMQLTNQANNKQTSQSLQKPMNQATKQ